MLNVCLSEVIIGGTVRGIHWLYLVQSEDIITVILGPAVGNLCRALKGLTASDDYSKPVQQ